MNHFIEERRFTESHSLSLNKMQLKEKVNHDYWMQLKPEFLILHNESNRFIILCFISYLPTPPLVQDVTQGQFLSGVLTGLNSEFFFP